MFKKILWDSAKKKTKKKERKKGKEKKRKKKKVVNLVNVFQQWFICKNRKWSHSEAWGLQQHVGLSLFQFTGLSFEQIA